MTLEGVKSGLRSTAWLQGRLPRWLVPKGQEDKHDLRPGLCGVKEMVRKANDRRPCCRRTIGSNWLRQTQTRRTFCRLSGRPAATERILLWTSCSGGANGSCSCDCPVTRHADGSAQRQLDRQLSTGKRRREQVCRLAINQRVRNFTHGSVSRSGEAIARDQRRRARDGKSQGVVGLVDLVPAASTSLFG